MPNQPKTPVRGVRLPVPTWEALQSKAKAEGVTPSDLVRTAIERFLEQNTEQHP